MTTWAQRNVALRRADGDPRPSAHALFVALAPVIDAAKADGSVDLFTFQRKHPDVRLRFGAPGAPVTGLPSPDSPSAWSSADLRAARRFRDLQRPDDALATIDRALDDLVADGTVERWFPSPYEPEVRKLGGDGASDALHRHFDADTALWLAIELDDPGASPVELPSAAVIAAALADDLFLRVLRDRDEVWDAWANLADLVPAAEPGDVEAVERELSATATAVGQPLAGPDAPRNPSPLLPLAQAAGGRIADELARAASSLDATAVAIDAELEAGRLRIGPRAILPFAAQLDLQRWGLGGPQQAAVAAAMMSAWDPAGGLRGR